MSDEIKFHLVDNSQEPAGEKVPEKLRKFGSPGDLIIGTADRIAVRIGPRGNVEVGEGYTPETAADAFWAAVGRRRAQEHAGGLEPERQLIARHMEAILSQIGRADLAVQRLRELAGQGDESAGQRSGAALVRLEQLVHQAIEFGRALAQRDAPIPEIPSEIPAQIRSNPDSQYEGRSGVWGSPSKPEEEG